ncbi:MAG: ABC transporter permease subunit [Gemmatimonadales bacterium]
MSTAGRILAFGLQNQLRNRWIVGYGLLFALLTDALFRFGGSGPRVVVSLLNVVLLVIPLVSVVFGTLHLSNSREFIELLLAQPVSRSALYVGLYFGLALPLAAAFALGVAVPVLLHGGAGSAGLVTLLLSGCVLTLVFTSLAFVAGVHFDDRARGLGMALMVWFAATVLYDGVVLLLATLFADWPLEMPMLVASLLNPVDLARVLMLLSVDAAALMGYTGAVFEKFFGTGAGLALAGGALLAWTAVPFLLGLRGFARKDF